MPRATKNEMEERIIFVHRLHDMGLSSSTIVAQLQREFNISRATAFRSLTDASKERESSPIQLAPPRGAECLHEAIGVLHDSFVSAAVSGQFKEVTKLSKELRETCEALGMAAQHRKDDAELDPS